MTVFTRSDTGHRPRPTEKAVGNDPSIDQVLVYCFGPNYIWDHADLEQTYHALITAGITDLDVHNHLRASSRLR